MQIVLKKLLHIVICELFLRMQLYNNSRIPGMSEFIRRTYVSLNVHRHIQTFTALYLFGKVYVHVSIGLSDTNKNAFFEEYVSLA